MARIVEGEARAVILAHARDLFLAEGSPNVSMRRIAKAVGVTPMALYRHFDNKEVLQIELLRDGFRTFDSYLARSERGADAAERLDLLVAGFRDFALEEPAYFELMFLTGQTLDGLRDRREVRKAARPTFRRLVDGVAACMKTGDLEPGNAEDVALTLLAQATGLAALYRSGNLRWSRAEARRRFDASFAATLAGFRRGLR